MNQLSALILAAGQGTRMQSTTPKVLHPVAGKPMLIHIVETLGSLTEDIHVVHGFEGDKIRSALANLSITWAHQEDQLGTAHAVSQAIDHISEDHLVLIVYGDCPLLTPETLKHFYQHTVKSPEKLGLITAVLDEPFGYGRIVRDQQQRFIAIVEEKNASSDEKSIREISSGIYLVPARDLQRWLPKINNNNTQKEYLLTDIIAMAVNEGRYFETICLTHPEEIMGVNDRLQLATVERIYQMRQAKKLLAMGVTLADLNRIDIRGNVVCASDVTIDVNVVLSGQVKIASGCTIGANSILTNVTLGENVIIHPHSIIEDAIIENDCEVGPFARIRPGTTIKKHAKIGNFVEIKKSTIGENSKASHLSYLGDAAIGKNVNIGCGTITCNYDGVRKHQTLIEDGAFIGSNVNLVAPVTVGKEATIGAGSTITRPAPANQLTVSRSKQISFEHWQRPLPEKEK